MNLGFKTKINGKPTHFVEKIWCGLIRGGGHSLNEYLKEYNGKAELFLNKRTSKIHTIREDKSGRWKVGNKVHFVINNRTKNRFQFAPIIKVKSIQTIKIFHSNEMEIRGDVYKHFLVGVDDCWAVGAYLKNGLVSNADKGLIDLASNDGFGSVQEFVDWFKEDFTGKIIHWTYSGYGPFAITDPTKWHMVPLVWCNKYIGEWLSPLVTSAPVW